MYIQELYIENFRTFGSGEAALTLELNPGLVAIIGENDSGKTTIIDALRLVLGSRDQEPFRVDSQDFHAPSGRSPHTDLWIRCKFGDLVVEDIGTFAEHLSYEGASKTPVLYVSLRATDSALDERRYTQTELRSGPLGDGPSIDGATRVLLGATYLRPLRDAERAMTAGRRSRLSQVLQHTDEIRTHGKAYDATPGVEVNPKDLSVIGIGDLANALLANHRGVEMVRERLNARYLAPLSFSGAELEAQIAVSGIGQPDDARLRHLLEKLELELRAMNSSTTANRGLGSNNLLFMACELLLLGADTSGVRTLLIEEPEAHLHPQRQLRLMRFLVDAASLARDVNERIQVILTTHSPNLASAIPLDSILLLSGGRGLSLARGKTLLSGDDYGFLSRFLDATKANLFFARGLLIVEGDAEALLLPELARLIGRDLAAHGVSIVNVGHTGLRRYARIFQRSDTTAGQVRVPVACIADLDVMPDCAPEILGLFKQGESPPAKRNWRTRSEVADLNLLRASIEARASGQSVRTFVADYWTLEFDLARSGLSQELWVAICQAERDDDIAAGDLDANKVKSEAEKEFLEQFGSGNAAEDEMATRIYKQLKRGVSKAITAQYLARNLAEAARTNQLSATELRQRLPKYLISAIEYATGEMREATIE